MFDWPATLHKVTCPALAMRADPDLGAALKPEGLDALQAQVPQLEAVCISGAGHSIRREKFDRYMEVVRGFLTKVATME